MNFFVVAYQLNSPGQDYASLIEKIESRHYCKLQRSLYVVATNEDRLSLSNDLLGELDSNDQLLISDFTNGVLAPISDSEAFQEWYESIAV